MKPTVGIVGLGIMGGAMAEALLEQGYAVAGFDVERAALQRLRKAGGQPLDSTRAVAEAADVVITALATAGALAHAAGQIASAKRRRGSPRLLVIEMSTLPIDDKMGASKQIAASGAVLLDCPVSGTAVRMKEGAWTIFVSGNAKAARRVAPVLGVFTRNAPYVGAFGNGTRMKFIANHLVAIYNVAVAESITFARRMGLDTGQVYDLFATSPVIGNGVYKLRGKFMVKRAYRPATMKVEVWQKDMQVIGDMARAVGAPTPLFSACAPIYNAAMAHGLAQSDTASVAEVFAALAAVPTKRRRLERPRDAPGGSARD
jgi:3-hydroxyisobutyrate dehydrogenase-like beta-hydroxyacid dehydrogenase